MKNILTILVACLLTSLSFAQANYNPGDFPDRISIDPSLKPFYHGVASGDPAPNAVMIWTRITPDSFGSDSLRVSWQMATDMAFSHVVNYGYTYTSALRDYTVKVDVCGLQPNTYYYYMFQYEGQNSIIARTKTAPTGDDDSLRFAVVSCSNYEHGYYNAYKEIADRNDVDAVLHLGDYIYEYASGDFGADIPGRTNEPVNEIITLNDYRTRHSHYKLDEDLRKLHQLVPFITTWDDHETANDSYRDGAENHTPSTEGPWEARKHNGVEAYNEWMPFRKPDETDTMRLFRKLRYGNLVDLIVLDTRLYDRDVQDLARTNDPTHKMVGPVQMAWLKAQLADTTTRYKLLCQQVMMAPLEIFGSPFNADQWDGYNTDRDTIINYVLSNNIKNVLVLTGDIHTSWAMDVPGPGYNASTGANAAFPEMVVTSVTSLNSPFPVPPAIITALNPHIKYTKLDEHGYLLLDLNKSRIQGDYYFVDNILSHSYGVSREAGYKMLHNERHIRSESTPLTGHLITAANPPLTPPTSISFALVGDDVYKSFLENTSTNYCLLPLAPACPGFTISLLQPAGFGSISGTDSCFTYTPNHNFNGPDSAIYLVCQDNPHYCDTLIVHFDVIGVNTRNLIYGTCYLDSSYSYCVSYDDIYGSIAGSGTWINPSNGTLSLTHDSCVFYQPNTGFLGNDTFAVYACDSVINHCDTAYFMITVKNKYNAEWVYYSLHNNSSLFVCNSFDELPPPYTSVTKIYDSGNGFFTLTSDTCISYYPGSTFVGNDTIKVIACNGFECDTIVYVINVTEPNGLEEMGALLVLGFYPNPFDEEVLIQYYTYEDGKGSIVLYDATGKEVLKKGTAPGLGLKYSRLDTQELAAGNYLISIELNGKAYTKKMIKR